MVRAGARVALAVVFLAILLDPAPMQESPVPGAANPIGIEAISPFLEAAQFLIVVSPSVSSDR